MEVVSKHSDLVDIGNMHRLCGVIVLAVGSLSLGLAESVVAQPLYQRYRQEQPRYEAPASYQRQNHNHANYSRRGYEQQQPSMAGPQVSGGYYQRPYPYHLDYYRMRWGGSYAPYFGNLYGPPNVVWGMPYGGYYGGGYYYPQPPMVPHQTVVPETAP